MIPHYNQTFCFCSFVSTPMTESTIVCVSCGNTFPFSQTIEGRCLRDHALHSEREQLKFAVHSSSQRGGNVTVTGPTIAMSSQQTQQQSQHIIMPPVQYVVWYRRRWKGLPCFAWLLILACFLFFFVIPITVALTTGKGPKDKMTTTTPLPTSQ